MKRVRAAEPRLCYSDVGGHQHIRVQGTLPRNGKRWVVAGPRGEGLGGAAESYGGEDAMSGLLHKNWAARLFYSTDDSHASCTRLHRSCRARRPITWAWAVLESCVSAWRRLHVRGPRCGVLLS